MNPSENGLISRMLRRSPHGMNPSKLLVYALAFAAAILVPMGLGACGCTMFTLASVALVLAGALGVGNTAFGALTVEREKKTLDSLRLTQLSAHEVLLGKLAPESGALLGILVAMGPTVIVSGLLSGTSLAVIVAVLAYAALAGIMAAVLGIFVSSLCSTTSQAVVAGWITKGAWLLALPLLDILAGAVLVQRVSPPIFSSLDPLAALGVLLVPEGASGTRVALPWLYPLATLVAVALMWATAAWRFSTGMPSGGGLAGEQVHAVYRTGFGPRWLAGIFPTLHSNPAFFRELTAQVRSGAGRWPGYLVFVVLFLAPTFYARSWTMKEMSQRHDDYRSRQAVVVESATTSTSSLTSAPSMPKGVHLRSTAGFETEAVLEGHTHVACMRTFLFQAAGVPLPMAQLRFYQRVTSLDRSPSSCGEAPPRVGSYVPVKTPDLATAAAFKLPAEGTRTRNLSDSTRGDVTRSSLHVGLAGAIALFLLYLSIRYSAFLANAVTGEKARRTWEDLALTGIRVDEAMGGKVVGAIILPTLQMTAVFPLLLLFVFSGNLSGAEVVALYAYALALSLAAAMLGLWASATSGTSHDAHLRALLLVIVAFFVQPLVHQALQVPLILGALVGLFVALANRRSSVAPWAILVFAMAVAPQALSPLTAAVSFMPSLTASQSYLTMLGVAPASVPQAMLNFACGVLMLLSLARILWESTLCHLADPRQADALKATSEVAPTF